MLGGTSAGKTCFMLGMYDAMKQGVNGFTFTAKDMDADLDLSEKWEQLVDPQEGEDRWPKPSVQTEVYEFGYCYGLKRFIGFDWIDYRGGVLKEASGAEGREELLQYFRESACIFMCVPGNLLTRSIKGRETTVRTKAAIDRMNGFITQNFPNDVRPSIAIVITKCDLMNGKRYTDEVIEEIKLLFNPLFAPGAGWSVMICPVTLGQELSENMAEGEIAPVNIYLPVTYAAYQAFKQEQASIEGEQSRKRNRKEELGRNWLSRLFNKKDIGDLDGELIKNEERRRQIETNMRRLVQELTQIASTYYDGEEITLDA